MLVSMMQVTSKDHKRIDEINILAATMEAMAESVAKLRGQADYVFIDGNRVPSQIQEQRPTLGVEAVVKGDSKVYSIAAASVIAKVTRDRQMLELHQKYPQYNFAQHKGYPTKAHVQAIAKHGPCPYHRMTFAPLKHMK